MIAEGQWRAYAERDVQEDLARGRQAPAPSRFVNQLPDLLIAWAGQAESVSHDTDAAVGLGDRESALVEAFGRRDEAHVDSWSRANHTGSVAKEMQRARKGSAPKYPSNSLLLGHVSARCPADAANP